MVWWTIGRIIWGILVLTTILQGWLTNAYRDRQVYGVVLVGLFIITEWIPFFVSMDVSLLASLSAERGRGGEGREGGEVGTYGTLLVPDLEEDEDEERGREGRGGITEKSRRSGGDRNEMENDEVEEEEGGKEDVEEGRADRMRNSAAGTSPFAKGERGGGGDEGGGGGEGGGERGGKGGGERGGGGGGGFLLYPSSVKT